MAQPHAFEEHQREELRKEELLSEQIEELEKALPNIRNLVSQLPPLTKVRAHIRKISGHVDKAIEELERIHDAAFPDETNGHGPSLARILRNRNSEARGLSALDALEAYDALDERGGEGMATSVVTLLEDLRRALTAAEDKIMAKGRKGKSGTAQRRSVAHWEPIERIDRALLHGWLRHHEPGYPCRQTRTEPLPAYRALTVSPSGPFMRVATVCYEAVGINTSADKAIRRYLVIVDKRRERDLERRRNENKTLPESEKYRPIDLETKPRRRGAPKKK